MSQVIVNELGLLNKAILRYQEATRKTPAEVLLKQGAEVGFALARRFKDIMPERGRIRSERLSALKSRSSGIKVRSAVREAIARQYGAHQVIGTRQMRFIRGSKRQVSVASIKRKGKRLNLQALMVQRELNLRESGRGFLSQAARFSGLQNRLKASGFSRWFDRYRKFLSQAGLSVSTASGTLTFTWSGASGSNAAAAIQKPKAQAKLLEALAEARGNIETYLNRKLGEDLGKAFLK